MLGKPRRTFLVKFMHSPDYRSAPLETETAASSSITPGLSLYLRKLVRQNLDRLALIESAQPAELDPISLFDRLCQPGSLSASAIQALTIAVDRHRVLLQQGVKGRRTLHQTETEIFTLLGLQLTLAHKGGTILIVDDTPGNLKLLSAALVQHGYEVRNAINGLLALSGAKTIRPDLILLDIMMPGINGYEVCERLKQDPQTQDIPVIFMSAIDGGVDKAKAFDVGGVDYVGKPFQIEEVLARIAHQFQIGNLQSRLEEQNLRLQQDAQNRQSLELYYQQLWQGSSDGMYRTTADGSFTSVNQAFAEIVGYDTPAQLIAGAKNAADFYVQPSRWHEFVAQIQQQGQVINFPTEVRQRDGDVIWISTTAQALTDDVGQVLSYEGRIQEIPDKTAIVQRENNRRRTRRLLVSLFPKVIAKQFIREPQNRFSRSFPQTTLLSLSIDDVDLRNQTDPQLVINRCNQLLKILETTAERHGIEYMRSLGTTFLVASGVPTPQPDHADRMVRMALDLQQQGLPLQVRMGIHSGAIVAGIVGGEQRLSYELYGETVAIAQQLTQQGAPQQILLSAVTKQALTGSYPLQPHTTGAGESYWLGR
jgi:adenylate cyclase